MKTNFRKLFAESSRMFLFAFFLGFFVQSFARFMFLVMLLVLLWPDSPKTSETYRLSNKIAWKILSPIYKHFGLERYIPETES
jgi:hypothetical protein